ncbi:AAA family ATPase [Sandaracinobacter neustonicus]|uniref:AAA family ATPase n=1 Tax=Sandaracinobacter neustonicus TaxID=1715348 RepID=A0A501XHP0_9SPHN|nr:sigma 54-interacting transcriptional regulator [Sandaracinobacter neustonicus]TPE60151.1 AAA family ATPase [Sandaracinobacter neustonicus]
MTDTQRDQEALGRQFANLLAAPPMQGPVAADPLSRSLLALATQAARSSATILVTGPSGAGKDVIARFLHAESQRAGAPFLALNCAALPEAMLESLLFGHERGAFTGALAAAPGLFRAAGAGTLFLDEIGELPLPLQAKLLRAIEAREVLPLGATAPVPFEARLIAATNRDLQAEARAGRFREDLYWRLSVFPLALAPLADRPADILPLAAHMLRDAQAALSPAALGALVRHPWPGNVRELANRIERARILAGDGPVTDAHLDIPAAPIATIALPGQMRRHEADALSRALAETGGRRREAARRLGISERALRYKLAAQEGRPRASAGAGAPA